MEKLEQLIEKINALIYAKASIFFRPIKRLLNPINKYFFLKIKEKFSIKKILLDMRDYLINFLSSLLKSFKGQLSSLNKENIKNVFLELNQWRQRISIFQFLLSLAGLMLIGYSSFVMIQTGNKIYRVKTAGRTPASTIPPEIKQLDNLKMRTQFFELSEKQFIVDGILLPVYSEGEHQLRTIRINFIFESSNVYIKSYLTENLHVLKDHLSTSIEPITPSLTIQEEGKRIIKEKVRIETNNLLKKLKISGEITELSYIDIIGI